MKDLTAKVEEITCTPTYLEKALKLI